jgi:hypothetical protein
MAHAPGDAGTRGLIRGGCVNLRVRNGPPPA